AGSGEAHARTTGRRHRRRGRPPRLRAHAPDARAAHPPREGDLEHLHERGSVRADGDHLPRHHGQAGTSERGRAVAREVPLRCNRARQDPRCPCAIPGALLQGVHAPAPEVAGAGGAASLEGQDPGRRPPQGTRPTVQGLSPRRGDREADAEGDRRLLPRASRGGGVRPPMRDAKPAYDKLIFELSSPGRFACSLPASDVPESDPGALLPKAYLREAPPELPEVSEVDVIRHYSRLSQMNYGVDTHFYPLGSCTMKYNPKINEDMARLQGFLRLHPLAPEAQSQRALGLMHELARDLAEISGMDEVTLEPAAGAQGELCGVLMIRAYHLARGERRHKVLIPDSAHGTNPASTALAGYSVVQLKSDENGEVDLEDLARALDEDVAAFMITQPNTLGLFESRIHQITEMCRAKGVQVYMDGANFNAILGLTRPGDLGFDVCHFNLHKTFTTPHGGGGPGAGPVGIKSHLAPFLPVPV